MLDEAAERARRTYDAAADHYDDPGLAFWARCGARTVERLRCLPARGCSTCRAGRARRRCRPRARSGPRLRHRGRRLRGAPRAGGARGGRRGPRNITFRTGDMRAPGCRDGAFDAVVSVFGIFFAPDMPAAAAEFWRMVRPGGVLAVTIWGPDAFDPGASAFGTPSARSGPTWSACSTRGTRS